jgi:hypothetical protein
LKPLPPTPHRHPHLYRKLQDDSVLHRHSAFLSLFLSLRAPWDPRLLSGLEPFRPFWESSNFIANEPVGDLYTVAIRAPDVFGLISSPISEESLKTVGIIPFG